MGSSRLEELKPVIAMVAVQCIYAGMSLSCKVVFTEGMKPSIFVVYRQGIATLFLAPITILARGCSLRQMALGVRGFSLVFIAALLGATLTQYFYYKGLDLADPSMATAMINLLPALTFVMAVSIGLEQLKLSIRSIAKVIGAIICVGGAITMAFFRGPALQILRHLSSTSSPESFSGNNWMIGCFYLIGSSCCWSTWLIIQVPICERYLDPLSYSVWMCLLGTIQSAILALILGSELDDWKINSIFDLLSCLFAGIFGSGVSFFLQAWATSRKGPLFTAMFNPLNTVITTMVSIPLLHQDLYVGSLLGALAIIVGLYIVLWGKARDLKVSDFTNSRDDALIADEIGTSESLLGGHNSYSLL